MKTLAIILIVLGILMMVVTGFTFVTKEEIADVGPIEIHQTEKHPVYWSPITGAVITGIGILLLVFSRRKN